MEACCFLKRYGQFSPKLTPSVKLSFICINTKFISPEDVPENQPILFIASFINKKASILSPCSFHLSTLRQHEWLCLLEQLWSEPIWVPLSQIWDALIPCTLSIHLTADWPSARIVSSCYFICVYWPYFIYWGIFFLCKMLASFLLLTCFYFRRASATLNLEIISKVSCQICQQPSFSLLFVFFFFFLFQHF